MSWKNDPDKMKWKRALESGIKELFAEDESFVCDVSEDFGLSTSVNIHLRMTVREDIQDSQQAMRVFLENPISDLADFMLQELDLGKEGFFPALKFCVDEVKFTDDNNHPQGELFAQGVLIRIKYFPRMIHIPSHSDGTMVIFA